MVRVSAVTELVPKKRRLFFALWPDEATRNELAHHRDVLTDAAGRAVSTSNLHLTLAFLGPVDIQTQHCVESSAAGLSFNPFTLQLTKFGYFPRPRVAWIGPDEIPAELTALRDRLAKCLIPCGFTISAECFRPHISLYRKSSRLYEYPVIEPVVWRVSGFVLVESVTHPDGVVYQVLKNYPRASPQVS